MNDLAEQHPWTFVFMVIFSTIWVLGAIAKECQPSLATLNLKLKLSALFNWWVGIYWLLFTLLATISTGMALVLAFDERGAARIKILPEKLLPLTVAAIGVFGFEFLFKKLIVGFGENTFDLNDTMKNLLAQAQAATIFKAQS
jgi:hypothetical protein